MQKEYIADYSFKGDRDYVHGTDIINNFLRLDFVAQDINFKFLSPLKSNALWHLSAANDQRSCQALLKHAVVSGKFVSSNHLDIAFFLVPELASKISSRYNYDESIVNSTLIKQDEKKLEINFDHRFSWIEYLVSAMKYACTPYCNTSLRLASFSILDPQAMSVISCCHLKLEKILAGKYFKAGIYADNNTVSLANIEFLSI